MIKEDFKNINELIFELKKMISSQIKLQGEDFDENKDFVSDYGVDSLDLLLLISEIEDIMKVRIETEDAEKMRTFADVRKYVESKYL